MDEKIWEYNVTLFIKLVEVALVLDEKIVDTLVPLKQVKTEPNAKL